MARLIDAADAAEIVSEKYGIPLSELVDTFCEISTVEAVSLTRGVAVPASDGVIIKLTHQCNKCASYILPEDNFCANCGQLMTKEVK